MRVTFALTLRANALGEQVLVGSDITKQVMLLENSDVVSLQYFFYYCLRYF